MSRECALLIKDGATPAEIAKQLSISPKSVIQYLDVAIGQSLISRSDVFLNIEERLTSTLKAALNEEAQRPVSPDKLIDLAIPDFRLFAKTGTT